GCDEDEIMLWYYFEKIEHVFYNLLSNAFKFTPSEGTILLKVTKNEQKQRIKISITDSGPGIPKKELKEIFTLYYQCDEGKKLEGSGIGLALTKELIEMHHGKIKAKSKVGKGSSFRIHLSLKETIFSFEEKSNEFQTKDNLQSKCNGSIHEVPVLSNGNHMAVNGTHSLLIVEDNVEMQIFLKGLLQGDYRVDIAENELQALNHLKDYHPDLSSSDIMMPVIDGIKTTREIQKNKSTSHIPIIQMTAKNTTKTRLSGLKTGAGDFINKPFNAQELVLKVNSLIKA